jgi:S-DNA-T family DNA segregation ATPase FtsK/SpoIIIE
VQTKTGTKPTARRKTRSTVRRKRSNPFRLFDVLGVALVFLCPITLIALLTGDSSGILGRYIVAFLRVSVGIGAWMIPFLLLLLGCVFITGPLRIIRRNVGIGSWLAFLVVITWAALTASIDNVTDPAKGGGYVGRALAHLLHEATGDKIGYVVLFGLAVIAAVVIVDVPLASLIDKVREAWAEWREAAAERREVAHAMRAKQVVAKPKVNEVVKESRKRTLASIFNREADADGKPGESEAPSEKPPVRILTLKPVKSTQQSLPEVETEPIEPGEFRLPPTTLLAEPPPPPPRVESELRANIEIIEQKLAEFKVDANVVEIAHGPTVARYEIRLAPGIKVNKIVGLADDLAMALAAIDVRLEAPIPGKAAIGVEVPNKAKAVVGLREIVESKPFRESSSKLTFALGKDVSGKPIVADLAKMPHLLIGGSTNSGKSVCLNSLIASLLYRVTPDECKLVLIDPKRVELSMFDGIPHLTCPVVKSAKQAAGIFRAVVQEMEHRYDILGQCGVRNIDGYNEKMGASGDRMPYMVVVVDELCDLMMQAAAEVEGSITRIAQLARAVGIHLVIATQRPSVDVITGVIKANISSRIAFAVSSHHDSRTILDQKGAERLIGRGRHAFPADRCVQADPNPRLLHIRKARSGALVEVSQGASASRSTTMTSDCRSVTATAQDSGGYARTKL